MKRLSPSAVLHDEDSELRVLPSCEHVAGRERFIDKALQLQDEAPYAFDVTMDLEDGAPAGRESEHADLVTDLLKTLPTDRPHRVGVRLHDVLHPHFHEDVQRVLGHAGDRVSYVVLPKARDRAHVEYLSSFLHELAVERGRHRTWPIHVLIETQSALADIAAIASHPDVETLDFGSMDFISDHNGAISSRCMRSPDQFEHALMRRAKTSLVAAALLSGRVPVHNVTLDVKNPETTRQDARRARDEFGFLRMWSIHPIQIEPIVSAMAPSHEDATTAARILVAAQDADWGPIRLDDELHDRASYRYEWAVLRRSHLAGVDVGDEARDRFF